MNLKDVYGKYIEQEELDRISKMYEDQEKQREAVHDIATTRMRNEYNYRLTYIGQGKYKNQNGNII